MSEQMMNEQAVVEPLTSEISEVKTEAPAKKKLGKKQIGIISAIAAVVIAVAVGVGIYSAPSNRLTRQLELGQKYLAEQNYEQAILAFEKAIEIDDRSMQAYAGEIEAYLQLGDEEGLVAVYDRARTVIGTLDDEFIAANFADIVNVYLYADDVYKDSEKIINALEEALVTCGDNAEIKQELVTEYLDYADACVKDENYNTALECYDRLLELDAENEDVQKGLCDCLNPYIEELIKSKKYDEVRRLADKYKDVAKDIDFDEILIRIAELERIDAENLAFMQKVYDLMEAEDYGSMSDVDGSEEAVAFVERMESDRYIYIPEDNQSLNGIGAGIYKFGEGGYYFFYGQIVDGERKGQGVTFCNTGIDIYKVFTGEWQQDAPNGYGENLEVAGRFDNGGVYSSYVVKGEYVNGLCNGAMEAYLTATNGAVFDLSYVAVAGVPIEDRTQEYMNESGYFWGYQDEIIIYAFDGQGWDYVYSYLEIGRTLGVTGFNY